MDSVNKKSTTYEKVASTAPPYQLPVAIEDFKKMKTINDIRLMPNTLNAGTAFLFLFLFYILVDSLMYVYDKWNDTTQSNAKK